MTDKPKTATELAMGGHFDRQLEYRDRRVAMAIGAEMAERFFNPDRIDDVRDVREQIIRAAEMAAYDAVQKERELHAGDMEVMRAVMDSQLQMLQTQPLRPVVIDS